MSILPILAACSRDPAAPAPEAPPEPEFTLRVDPAELEVVTGPAGAAPVAFTATATYEDGSEQVLELVEWSLSNRSAGAIDDAGWFTPSTTNGGVTWVSARLAGQEAQATVQVVYLETQNPSGVDEALFDAPAAPVSGRWRYPEDGVNLPRNTPSIDFQWDPTGVVATRLTLRSELSELVVYTPGANWVADAVTWSRIAATNAGGQVEVTLEQATGAEVWAEPPIHVNVNRMDATGAVMYWSTSVQGFVQIPFGGTAETFLTSADTGHGCQGCHAVSSTGLIAYTYDGDNGALALKNLSDKADVNPNAGVGNFKTFSPDGRFLLATERGNLRLLDGATGAFLGDARTNHDATQPDWSPDGALIAVALGPNLPDDLFMGGPADPNYAPTDIALIDVLGDGVFSEPRVIVDVTPPWRAYYPAWSPDGNWLAYNLSTGDSYSDADAELWVIDRQALRPPVRLDLANQPISQSNSWPRWGPLPDDEVLWVAFSSIRPYGSVVSGIPQIWVAGFDPAKAEAGLDPTWPAFWMPGQDPGTANHIPLWIP
ncbi:MAG: hypothetical protein ABMA64_17230 [Myxococcota bacterium]